MVVISEIKRICNVYATQNSSRIDLISCWLINGLRNGGKSLGNVIFLCVLFEGRHLLLSELGHASVPPVHNTLATSEGQLSYTLYNVYDSAFLIGDAPLSSYTINTIISTQYLNWAPDEKNFRTHRCAVCIFFVNRWHLWWLLTLIVMHKTCRQPRSSL